MRKIQLILKVFFMIVFVSFESFYKDWGSEATSDSDSFNIFNGKITLKRIDSLPKLKGHLHHICFIHRYLHDCYGISKLFRL
jgi:hypothetical protein